MLKGNVLLKRTLIGFVALMLVPYGAFGQGDMPPTQFSEQELDQMIAPIALYPDSLLAQVLIAATYPDQVMDANAWMKANPNLKGDALNDALDRMSWDLSVKALAPFPQVLAMMADQPDWTQKLGEAFVAQQADVMASVQKLRSKAYAAGNLKSSAEQKIVVKGDVYEIEPVNPQVVYVPRYDPVVVYGTWWWPQPPLVYAPVWPGVAVGVGIGVGIGFFGACAVGPAWGYGWGSWGWGGGNVNVNVNRNININKNVNINKNNLKTTNFHNVASKTPAGRAVASGAGHGRGGQAGKGGAATRDVRRGGAGAAGGSRGGAAGNVGRGGAGGKPSAGSVQQGLKSGGSRGTPGAGGTRGGATGNVGRGGAAGAGSSRGGATGNVGRGGAAGAGGSRGGAGANVGRGGAAGGSRGGSMGAGSRGGGAPRGGGGKGGGGKGGGHGGGGGKHK